MDPRWGWHIAFIHSLATTFWSVQKDVIFRIIFFVFVIEISFKIPATECERIYCQLPPSRVNISKNFGISENVIAASRWPLVFSDLCDVL